MKELFLAVRALLMQIDTIKWVDLDKGQLENYDVRPSVAFPCALIKINIISAEDQGNDVQICKARVEVRLAFDYTGEVTSATPEPVVTSSLQYLETAQAVYVKLQGYNENGFHRFSRQSTVEEKRADGLKVAAIPFLTGFRDVTAQA